MAAKLLAIPQPTGVVDAARVADDPYRIVGTPGFYPVRKVGADYVDRFMSVMEKQLRIARARLAAILKAIFR